MNPSNLRKRSIEQFGAEVNSNLVGCNASVDIAGTAALYLSLFLNEVGKVPRGLQISKEKTRPISISRILVFTYRHKGQIKVLAVVTVDSIK